MCVGGGGGGQTVREASKARQGQKNKGGKLG